MEKRYCPDCWKIQQKLTRIESKACTFECPVCMEYFANPGDARGMIYKLITMKRISESIQEEKEKLDRMIRAFNKEMQNQ